MTRLIFLSVLLSFSISVIAQIDPVGSGRAIQFDGIDDYIDLGNIYDDLALPVTVSAWVYLDPSITGAVPLFHSQDNQPIYNGVNFLIHPSYLAIVYGDGRGENSSDFRRSKTGFFSSTITGRWIHVTGIMRGATDMDLYLNGVNLAGTYTGDSPFTMASNFPDDVAKIGKVINNGLASVYKGKMDEIKVWNRALSESEIRTQMCKKLTGTESGLIGYWTFNETSGNTVFDKSSNGFNGQLVNGPSRVYSGAPIGDESISSYQSNWSGVTLTTGSGSEEVKVSNITGNPEGVHVYIVHDLPSQTQDLDISNVAAPYFGVFAAAGDINNSFDLSHFTSPGGTCELFVRPDNSVESWASANSTLIGVIDRTELIKGNGEPIDLQIDLGADEEVCPFVSRVLSPVNDPIGYEFTWQDGSKQSTLQVVEYGTYWVKVKKGCSIDSDTIIFSKSITDFTIDLGDDEVICPFIPKLLSPLDNPTGFEFTWQDGSKQSTLQTSDYGEYWVTVQNDCVIGSDTIKISKLELTEFFIPNVFTPNEDELNQHFMVDDNLLGSRLYIYNGWGKLVYESSNYQNNWDASGIPTGTYYYFLKNDCTTPKKGWVSILR